MISLRPADAFLRRAATRERALLMRCIGHPQGVLSADNDDWALRRANPDALAPSKSFHASEITREQQ